MIGHTYNSFNSEIPSKADLLYHFRIHESSVTPSLGSKSVVLPTPGSKNPDFYLRFFKILQISIKQLFIQQKRLFLQV